jgi:YVTN family beta-propeller protein
MKFSPTKWYSRLCIGSLCISSMLILPACAYETKEEAAIRLGNKNNLEDSQQSSNIVAAGKLTSVQFYVPSMLDHRIDVIDVVTSQVVGQVALKGSPTVVIFSSTKRDAYVSQQDDSSIAIINTQTLQVEHEVEVGPLPHGLVLTPDNRTLYVATVDDSFIYKIDTQAAKSGKQLQADIAIDLGVGARTNYLVYRNNYLYISDHVNHNVYIVDTKTNSLVRTINTSKVPRAIALNESGTRLYVPCAGDEVLEVYDTATGELLHSIVTLSGPTDVYISEDESQAWVTLLESNAVSAIDLKTHEVIYTVEKLPGAKHLAVNRLESKLYVTLSNSNQVAILDAQTGEILGYIKVGQMPHGIQLKALPGIGGSCG